MDVNIHKGDVTSISRYTSNNGELTMVTLRCGNASVGLFMSAAQADILYPALQKVYENAENSSTQG